MATRSQRQPQSSITVRSRDAEEVFSGAGSFVGTVPPESLRRLREIVLVTRSVGLVTRFTISRRSWWRDSEQANVRLEVTGSVENEFLVAVTEAVAAAAARGYRAYWGECRLPGGISIGERYQTSGTLLRTGINGLAGLLFGVFAFLLATRLQLQGLVVMFVMLGGATIPWIIDRLVPSVEVAINGRTRLLVFLSAQGVALASTTGVYLIGWLLGDG